MDFTLPIVDFSSYRGGDAVSRKEMIHEIYQATQDAGFFYLKNFGIAPEHIAGTFQHSRTFFALPAEKKARSCGIAAIAAMTESKLRPSIHPNQVI